ncbi:MAG: thioredoxin family protein [Acidobacteria bacterium]|nr:thioredoxin family protein [Acidobacteriota bacterium]
MTRIGLSLATGVATVLFSGVAFAVKVGEQAPSFAAKDSKGKEHKLSDYSGKYIVLEWHNQGCPFVQKHYDTGNMQKLQREWTSKGVIWLTVISSAPGKQGYVTGPQADAYVNEKKAAPSAVLLDPSGTMGRAYSAKTSPHMIVVDPKGVVIYNGAIDDRPTAEKGDVSGARNYVAAALTEAMAGKAVTTPTTVPYGCSVKY